MAEFINYLKTINDCRQQGKVVYPISEILFLVLFATICNADNWEDKEDFGKRYINVLRKFFPFTNGIPSHDRIRTFMGLINPKITTQMNLKWAELRENGEQEKLKKLVNIDGKTMKGNKTDSQKANHILTAFSVTGDTCLGQASVDAKTNEITAIPELLDDISIAGGIVTIDAMGTQTAIAERIVKKNKADYILAVKRNQKNLFEEISAIFNCEIELEELRKTRKYHRTEEKARSQIEIREYYQDDELGNFKEFKKWQGCKSIGMVITTTIKDGIEKSREVRYYISSLEADVLEFSRGVRGHWRIESMHWHLDVTFKEDADKTINKIAAQNMNNIRKLSLAILKGFEVGKKASIQRKRYILSMDLENHADKMLQL